MSHAPLNKSIPLLIERAHLLATVRSFFAQKGYLELDTPLVSKGASIDAHIDLMQVECHGQKGYLVSSPEYAIKRLLASGFPSAYQLSHVFRAGETSARHNPEFCMIEWYRLDAQTSASVAFEALIEETLELIRLCIGPRSVIYHEYWDLFERYLQLDLRPLACQKQELARDRIVQWVEQKSESAPPLAPHDSLDAWLSYLISHHLEERLEAGLLHVIRHFPASQAALATTFEQQGLLLAHRFEIYTSGLELANGYHELQDAQEQRQRLEAAQQERRMMGKDPLKLDERFLEALVALPACCGVAVGFDRLLMLRTGASSIDSVLPLSWKEL